MPQFTEVLASLITLAGVWLTAQHQISGWALGIIGSLLYFFVCFQSSLYAESILQLFYVFLGIYGLVKWKNSDGKKSLPPVNYMTALAYALSVLCWLILSVVTGYILNKFTDTDVPYSDAFMTIAGLILTWQMARKYLESWLGWFVINTLNSILFLYKSLFFTMFLYMMLAGIALRSYFQWRKLLIRAH